jgi:GDP-L-fucose synthase
MTIKLNDTIFVAGHSGLLGSAFVRRFRESGYTNLILMNHNALDLEDSSAVNSFMQMYRPSYIFLAAGVVGGILENLKHPADLISRNLSIQLNVFKAAHKFEVKKVIFFGSSCMYPKNAEQPMLENAIYSGYLEFSSQSYSVSKLTGLQLGLAFNQQYEYQKFISLIPNSIFGPNDNFNSESGHVISSLIARFHSAKIQKLSSVEIWGTGKPRREFVYVDDVVDATLYLMNQDNLDFPINIGVDKDYSISELAQIIAKIVGYNGHIILDLNKPDGAPKKILDVTKLSNLGWKSNRNFEDDLNFTYHWYLNHIKTSQ